MIDKAGVDIPVTGKAELVIAAMLCFCAGGLYGWSALIPIIEVQFNASAAQSGLVFSIAIVAFTSAVIATPRLPPMLNGLKGCAVFGFIGALYLLLAMMASSYLLFLFAFGVGFGLCSGAIYINALGIAANTARPAIVTPLVVASFGLGGAVFGVLWRLLVLNHWGAAALMPLVLCLLLLSVCGLIVCAGIAPLDKAKAASTAQSQADQLCKGKPVIFGLLWFSFALGSAGGVMVLGLASKMTDSAGATAAVTSIAIAGVAIGNTLGRASVGGVNYYFKPINTALLAVVVVATGLLVMFFSTTAAYVAAGLIIVAIGYGATMPALVGAIYGKERFSRVFSFVFSAWGLAGLLAPWLAGIAHDRTNDFQLAILVALLVTICSVVTLMCLKLIEFKLSAPKTNS